MGTVPHVSQCVYHSIIASLSLVLLSMKCGISPQSMVWLAILDTFQCDATCLILVESNLYYCNAKIYECLLRESQSLLQKRELLSAILFSWIAVVHKPVAERFSNKLHKNAHYFYQHYLNTRYAAHIFSGSNSKHSNHFFFFFGLGFIPHTHTHYEPNAEFIDLWLFQLCYWIVSMLFI